MKVVYVNDLQLEMGKQLVVNLKELLSVIERITMVVSMRAPS